MIQLGQYIASKRHDAFEWGVNDCHTFVLEMHDTVYGTQWLQDLKNKYNTRMGAYRLAKTWDAQQQMQFMGYDEAGDMCSGDVVLVPHKGGYFAHIVLQNDLYSVDPDLGFTRCKIKEFCKSIKEYSIWRMTCHKLP